MQKETANETRKICHRFHYWESLPFLLTLWIYRGEWTLRTFDIKNQRETVSTFETESEAFEAYYR